MPSTSSTPDFDTFVKRFQEIDLPIATELNRVHNSDLVTSRMDTLSIRTFIDSTYQVPPSMASYGYAYGVRLPKDTFDYTALVYFKANNTLNAFVLKTFNHEKAVGELPLSAHHFKTNKTTTCQITKDRKIYLTTFSPYIIKQDTLKMTYSIHTNGQIIAEEEKTKE